MDERAAAQRRSPTIGVGSSYRSAARGRAVSEGWSLDLL